MFGRMSRKKDVWYMQDVQKERCLVRSLESKVFGRMSRKKDVWQNAQKERCSVGQLEKLDLQRNNCTLVGYCIREFSLLLAEEHDSSLFPCITIGGLVHVAVCFSWVGKIKVIRANLGLAWVSSRLHWSCSMGRPQSNARRQHTHTLFLQYCLCMQDKERIAL